MIVMEVSGDPWLVSGLGPSQPHALPYKGWPGPDIGVHLFVLIAPSSDSQVVWLQLLPRQEAQMAISRVMLLGRPGLLTIGYRQALGGQTNPSVARPILLVMHERLWDASGHVADLRVQVGL